VNPVIPYSLFRSKLKIHEIIINMFLIVIVKLVKLVDGTMYRVSITKLNLITMACI
jgi:hypothetical protein